MSCMIEPMGIEIRDQRAKMITKQSLIAFRELGPDGTWDKHPVTPLTNDFLRLVDLNNPHPLIYDFGCGKGTKTLNLALGIPNARVIGFDANGDSIEVARKAVKTEGVEDRVQFVEVDILDLNPMELELADGIHEYQSVLTHAHRSIHKDVIGFYAKILHKRGVLLVNAFSKNSVFYGTDMREKIASELRHQYSPEGAPLYSYFYGLGEIEELVIPHFEPVTSTAIREIPHPTLPHERNLWEALLIRSN